MKTTKDWIDALPADIRERAYINITSDILEDEDLEPTLYRCISCAFLWGLTSEGYLFWLLVANGEFDEARKSLTKNTTKP